MNPDEPPPQKPSRKRRSQRRKTLERRSPVALSVVILLGFIAYGINMQLDHSRQRAEDASLAEGHRGT
ncbi:hypothetical protein DM793_15180 [Paenarthrobacter nitroguajacolicus]|nr:hypothetical protein [Paenarthrobacter nitroguajacolicus]